MKLFGLEIHWWPYTKLSPKNVIQHKNSEKKKFRNDPGQCFKFFLICQNSKIDQNTAKNACWTKNANEPILRLKLA